MENEKKYRVFIGTRYTEEEPTTNGKVFQVGTEDWYLERREEMNKKRTDGKKNTKTLDEAIESCNAENALHDYQIYEVPQPIYEAFRFLLGEKGYKVAGRIQSLVETIIELRKSVDEIDSDMMHIEDKVDEIRRLAREDSNESE
jgi:hypothetical protein